MLRFRNTSALAIAVLLFAIAINIVFGLPFYSYIIIVLSYSLILFYGCYYIGSNFFIKVICSAKTNKKVIAISFDDGPAAYTSQILSVLKEQQVEAVFFCIGSRIRGNENVVSRIHQEGHIIGNHSFSHHFWFDLFPAKKMLNDLRQMDEIVSPIIGLKPRFFRPPYGVTNPAIKNAVINGRYIPVGWSVRSMDTVIKSKEKLMAKMVGTISPGAIFLFHDTSAATLATLPEFIGYVKQSGYEIVRLDKMLNLQPYA